MRLLLTCLLLTVGCSLFAGGVSARPKTDMVKTDSGDVVYCEIKELAYAKLTVKSHDMGTINIEWKHIVALKSDFYFRVEVKEVGRRFGSLEIVEGTKVLRVRAAFDTLSFPTDDVVEITPIEKKFWDRFDGSLSLGFNFTKASQVAQLTFDWTNIYRTERDLFDMKLKTIITSTEGDTSTTRNEDFSLAYYRLIKKRFNASTSLGLQRNDELGLLRRVIITLTGGVSPLKSNLHNMLLSTGLALNSELGSADTSEVTQSLEGVIRVSYSLFKYSSPKANVNTTLVYFPSITEPGRHRIDFNLSGSYELVSDFTIGLTYYTNYDSQPTTEDANTTDYGIITSVGWTY